MIRNSLDGQIFSRLTVCRVAGLDKRQNVLWLCKCSCGKETQAYAYDLRNGKVKSCGCLNFEGRNITHGMSKKPIYNIWATMLQRCTNPRDANFPRYGGRGITVCKRWLDFSKFFADMGDRPEGKSLERRHNNKGYSPSNCCWATRVEQGANTRRNVHIRIGQKTYVLAKALSQVNRTLQALHYQMRTYSLTHQEVITKWLTQKKVK